MKLQKNFSITSLIKFISSNGFQQNLFKSDVLCSFKEGNSHEENLEVERIKWRNFNKLRIFFLNKIINYDVVHIHGMWAPIQLYSIILCLIYNKKVIIHPHGMLLSAAINYNGLVKKITKKIFLFFLKFLFTNKKNILFAAITKEEFEQILILFPRISVELIQNNIPFDSINVESKKDLEKAFVFFGRIHPHKNILEMIRLFVESNLIEKGWKLEIYGIEDDNIYLNKIKKYLNNIPEVKILKPVFGDKKSEIIKRSWANILYLNPKF